MNDKKVFCLLDEPWLKVQKMDFSTDTVSLKTLFANAHQYKGLAGAIETENVAVLRFLLAVLHTVVSRYDYNGNEIHLKNENDAYNRWEDYWNNRCFPSETINNYLEQWRDKFWLIHPDTPFMQVKALSDVLKEEQRKDKKTNPPDRLRKFDPELFESANKQNLFAVKKKNISKDSMQLSDAARALLHSISYTDCAQKKFSSKQTWASTLGHIYAIGKNLFETLMFNLCLLDEKDCVWPYSNPIWENDKNPVLWKDDKAKSDGKIGNVKITLPDNPAQLYTMLSRYVILEYSEQQNKITDVLEKAGNIITDDDMKNLFVECMTKWKLATKKGNNYYTPQIYDNNSPVWREFSFIFINDEKQHLPGVVRWLKKLAEETIVSFQDVISFRFLSITYLGGSMKSGIDNIYTDQLSFQLELLKSLNNSWSRLVTDSIKLCETICRKLQTLDSDCQSALGTNNNNKNAVTYNWFNSINTSFRLWLENLRHVEDNDMLHTKIELWKNLKIKANKNAETIITKYGPSTLTGRVKNGKYYTIPGVYDKFKHELNKLIPNTIG